MAGRVRAGTQEEEAKQARRWSERRGEKGAVPHGFIPNTRHTDVSNGRPINGHMVFSPDSRYQRRPYSRITSHIHKINRRRRRPKKDKITAVYRGFHVGGGIALKGNFRSLKACQRACSHVGYCLAGDYDTGSGRCFLHMSHTACSTRRTHPGFVHFRKSPCAVPERSAGSAIFTGKFVPGGLEMSGVDSLQDCLKACTTAGGGGLASTCFGIDFNFSNHKCYIHGNEASVCPLPTEGDLPDQPNAVHVAYCP